MSKATKVTKLDKKIEKKMIFLLCKMPNAYDNDDDEIIDLLNILEFIKVSLEANLLDKTPINNFNPIYYDKNTQEE